MISETWMMISNSVFHIKQKMEFEKLNCFIVNFWRYSFGRRNDTIRYDSALLYSYEHFIVMKIMTEGNFLKAKLKIKSPKINRGT